MGHDLRGEAGEVRAVIGVTGQFSAVDDLLTGEENLLLMGRLLHLPAAERRARAAGLLERFDLAGAARRTPATYSGGMKRRLDIAMTLMGRPRLIFLDEPTTGLDPRSRRYLVARLGPAHRDRQGARGRRVKGAAPPPRSIAGAVPQASPVQQRHAVGGQPVGRAQEPGALALPAAERVNGAGVAPCR
jgi:hypothetical protein